MSEHLLERGKAIRRGKGNREGVTKIDEVSSRKEKGRWEKGWERWERGWACRGVQEVVSEGCEYRRAPGGCARDAGVELEEL